MSSANLLTSFRALRLALYIVNASTPVFRDVPHQALPRDAAPIVQFQSFTSTDCSNGTEAMKHSPKTAGICHAFQDDEKSFWVIQQVGTCKREVTFAQLAVSL